LRSCEPATVLPRRSDVAVTRQRAIAEASMREAPDRELITRIVLLGTGTPNAEPHRSGPSVAVVVGDTSYIVDCGPGVVRRATAALEMGIEALRPNSLTRLFLTHLHSDHTAGYPDLILTPWVLDRKESLAVSGPPGTQAMTEHILAAYSEDIRDRLGGLEPIEQEGYLVRAHEVEPGVVYEDSEVTVEAFWAVHGSLPSLGYKFQTPDRTIVVSGDTAPTEAVVEAARGCDVLIHEVYSARGFERLPPAWRRYHCRMHTSTLELAEIASQARPGLVILYHQLLWGTTEEELVAEIKEGYDGEVAFGKDLEVY
jgi:ribonuclease BN (tRNA processing enzyme)